jgi:hypothetical protein
MRLRFDDLLQFAIEANEEDPFVQGSNVDRVEAGLPPIEGSPLPPKPKAYVWEEVEDDSDEDHVRKYYYWPHDANSGAKIRQHFPTKAQAVKWLSDNGYDVGSFEEEFEDDLPRYDKLKDKKWYPWRQELIDEYIQRAEKEINDDATRRAVWHRSHFGVPSS